MVANDRNEFMTQRNAPLWPFMIGLTFLFAMSVNTPRSWEQYAQRHELRMASAVLAIDFAVPSDAASSDATATADGTGSHTGRTPASIAPPSIRPAVSEPGIAGGVRLSAPIILSGSSPANVQPAAVATPQIVSQPVPTNANPSEISQTPELPSVASPVSASPPASVTPSTPVVATIVGGIRLSGGVDPKSIVAAPTTAKPVAATVPEVTPVAVTSSNSPPSGKEPSSVSSIPAASSAGVPVAVPANTQIVQTGPKLSGLPASTNVSAATITAVEPKAAPTEAAVTARPTFVQPADSLLPTARESEAPLVAGPGELTTEPAWWPIPTDLFARLEKLRQSPPTRDWSLRVEALLRRLTAAQDAVSPQVVSLLDDLRTAAADPTGLDEQRLDGDTIVELRLARHALLRRVDVWESLSKALRQSEHDAATARLQAADRLENCLVEIETHTAAAGENGRLWHNYLLVDSLHRAASGGVSDDERRTIAREVLARIGRVAADGTQRDFLRRGPFAKLDGSLRDLADDSIDGRRLLAGIERLEQGGLPSAAAALADDCRTLTESSNPSKRQLAVWLTSYYRGANLRISVSDAFLNRLLPEKVKQQAPVRETILGMPTRGWSSMLTGLDVRFVPSGEAIGLRLEAKGEVNAATRTHSGPVRLFSHSNSHFAAQKEIIWSTTGIQSKPAEALSKSNSKLSGIESDFDRVPILGGIVSAMARDQHDENRSAAQREAAWKVSRQVEKGLDTEVEQRLKDADALLHQRVLEPLGVLSVAAELVDMHTTEERACLRLRIAGDDQLGAHTPRPRAYSDSLCSLQMHQSALNNLVDRLGLQGRRFTPAELYRHVVRTLRLVDHFDVSTLPDEVEWTFAAVDPISIRYEDGRMELRMSLDELKHAERSWNDFTVRVFLKPAAIDGRICLVRDGVVRLSGPNLRTTGQIALRTVFSKVFPDDMCRPLLPAELLEDQRFADLQIEHVDLRDGWLGLSIIGTAPPTAFVPQPEAPAPGTAKRLLPLYR